MTPEGAELREKVTYYEWMDSKVHESISYGEMVASQVDLVLQVEVEVLHEEKKSITIPAMLIRSFISACISMLKHTAPLQEHYT